MMLAGRHKMEATRSHSPAQQLSRQNCPRRIILTELDSHPFRRSINADYPVTFQLSDQRRLQLAAVKRIRLACGSTQRII